MIRLILVVLAIGIFFILTPILCLIKWIIGKFDTKKGDLCALRMVQSIFKIILFLAGVKTTVLGEENIPEDQAVLYILNHRSFFDVVLTYARCPGVTSFMAKKEIARIPLLSTWMRFLHCLFLDRKDIKQGLKTILAAIDLIKNGISVFIFPEGTRSTNADQTEFLPFHEGSFKVAVKTDCLIVPVAMTNTSQIFEDHIPFVRRTDVILEYGKPFRPSELTKEQKKAIGSYTSGIITDMVKKNLQ